MPPRARLVATLGLASATLVVDAEAQPHAPCRVTESSGVEGLSAPWRRALDALERELDASAACHGMKLTVSWDGHGVRISARSADGGEATRLVAAPSALAAVAVGLLASAPGEPAVEPEDPLELPPAAPPPPPPPPPMAPFAVFPRLDVSASAGARAGFPTNVVMGDFEVRADLFIHEWLFAISMRAAPFSRSSRLANDLDAYQEAGLSIGLGRELRAGRSAFDITGGPNLSYIWMESDALNISTEHAQLRLTGVARWGYEVSSRVRLNALFDAELAPIQLFQPGYLAGLAPFPVVTVGLRIGTEVAL